MHGTFFRAGITYTIFFIITTIRLYNNYKNCNSCNCLKKAMSSIWNGTYTFARNAMLRRKKRTTPEISFDELSQVGQTGDVLLFSGNATFSAAEEIFTNSPFSHVGMLVVNPGTHDLYNWESTRDGGMLDVLVKLEGGGPRMRDLKQSVFEYQKRGGFVVYRKLYTPVNTITHTGGGGSKITYKQLARLATWMEAETSKSYEMQLWKLPSAYTHSEIIPTASDPSSVFCSELLVETWRQMGIYLKRKAEYYSPQDFSQDKEDLWSSTEQNLGFFLSKEYLIENVYS